MLLNLLDLRTMKSHNFGALEVDPVKAKVLYVPQIMSLLASDISITSVIPNLSLRRLGQTHELSSKVQVRDAPNTEFWYNRSIREGKNKKFKTKTENTYKQFSKLGVI